MDFLSRFLRKSPAKEMFTSSLLTNENTSGDQSSSKKHTDILSTTPTNTDHSLSVASNAKNNKISDESSDSSLDYDSANENNSPHDDSSSFPLSDNNLNKHQPESDIPKQGTNISPPTAIEYDHHRKLAKQKIYNEFTESFETPNSSLMNVSNSHLADLETCEIGEDPLSLNEKDFLTGLIADGKENLLNINVNRGCDNTENDSFILALSEETFSENITFNVTAKDVNINEHDHRQEREASVEVILEDENILDREKIENTFSYDNTFTKECDDINSSTIKKELESKQSCDIESNYSEDTESIGIQESDSYTKSRRDSDSSIFVIDSEGTNNPDNFPNAMEIKDINQALNEILYKSMNISKATEEINVSANDVIVENDKIEKKCDTEIIENNSIIIKSSDNECQNIENIPLSDVILSNNTNEMVSEMEKQDILNGNHLVTDNGVVIADDDNAVKEILTTTNETIQNKSELLINSVHIENNVLTNSQIDNSILALTLELNNYEKNVEASDINDFSTNNGNNPCVTDVNDDINYEMDVSMTENFSQADAEHCEPMDCEPMDCDESYVVSETASVPVQMVESVQMDDPFKTRARVQNSSDRDMHLDDAPKSFDENIDNPFITRNKMYNSNEHLNGDLASNPIDETTFDNNECSKLDVKNEDDNVSIPLPISNNENSIEVHCEKSVNSLLIQEEHNTNITNRDITSDIKISEKSFSSNMDIKDINANGDIEAKYSSEVAENVEELPVANNTQAEIISNNGDMSETINLNVDILKESEEICDVIKEESNVPADLHSESISPPIEICEEPSSLNFNNAAKSYDFDAENPFVTKCKVYNSNENLNIIPSSDEVHLESNGVDSGIDSEILINKSISNAVDLNKEMEKSCDNLSSSLAINGNHFENNLGAEHQSPLVNGKNTSLIIEKEDNLQIQSENSISIDNNNEIINDEVKIFKKPYTLNLDALNITGSIESIEIKSHDMHIKIESDNVEDFNNVRNSPNDINNVSIVNNTEMDTSLRNVSKNSLEDTQSLGEVTKDISQFSDTILASSAAESDAMSLSQISTNSNNATGVESSHNEQIEMNSPLKIVEPSDMTINISPKAFDEDMENPFVTKNKMHNSNERLNDVASTQTDEIKIVHSENFFEVPKSDTMASEEVTKTVVQNRIGKTLPRVFAGNLSPMSKSGDLMGMSPIRHSKKNGEKSERFNSIEYDLLTGGQMNNDVNNLMMDEEDDFKVPDELFKDPAAFDFLLNCGNSGPGGKGVPARDFGKESLFVKFDPLVGLPTGPRPGREPEIYSSPETSLSCSKVNEDVSTASGLAESCSSDSSVSAITSDTGKPTGTMSSVEQSFGGLSLQPQNSSPPVATVAAVPHSLNSNINVNLQTIDKPTQVVSPAKSTRQQYQPCTPPQLSSSKPTLPVTPAIAAIDRLINLGLNSPPPPPPVVVQPKETEMDPQLVKELQSVREILANQEQELLQANDRVSTLQQQLIKSNEEKESLIERVNEKNRNHRQMSVVMEEYERTMSSLIGEREIEKRQWLEEKVTLARERDEASSHLANIEDSFNDIHAKYERCKSVIQSYKTNEDVLKQTLARNDETLKKQVERYDQLRQHAMTQLDKASQEIDAVRKSSQAEIIKMQAMLKKADIQISSLQESLAQKTKNCEELTSICDELINKVG